MDMEHSPGLMVLSTLGNAKMENGMGVALIFGLMEANMSVS